MSKYYVNYGTGAGNEWVEGTLDEVMAIADNGATYTQADIKIMDENDNLIAIRRWWGVKFDPEESDCSEDEIISFGDFGYYDAWLII